MSFPIYVSADEGWSAADHFVLLSSRPDHFLSFCVVRLEEFVQELQCCSNPLRYFVQDVRKNYLRLCFVAACL